jgi:hypothetical protein
MELDVYFYWVYLNYYKFLKVRTLFEFDSNKNQGKRKISLFTWAGFQPSPSNWAGVPWAGSPPVKLGRLPWSLNGGGPAVAIFPVARVSGVAATRRWWRCGGSPLGVEEDGRSPWGVIHGSSSSVGDQQRWHSTVVGAAGSRFVEHQGDDGVLEEVSPGPGNGQWWLPMARPSRWGKHMVTSLRGLSLWWTMAAAAS